MLAEIRIRAERRLGELLLEQKVTVGLNRGMSGTVVSGSVLEPVRDTRPTLSDIDVDKKLSSHAQKVAAIPEASQQDLGPRVRRTTTRPLFLPARFHSRLFPLIWGALEAG